MGSQKQADATAALKARLKANRASLKHATRNGLPIFHASVVALPNSGFGQAWRGVRGRGAAQLCAQTGGKPRVPKQGSGQPLELQAR